MHFYTAELNPDSFSREATLLLAPSSVIQQPSTPEVLGETLLAGCQENRAETEVISSL